MLASCITLTRPRQTHSLPRSFAPAPPPQQKHATQAFAKFAAGYGLAAPAGLLAPKFERLLAALLKHHVAAAPGGGAGRLLTELGAAGLLTLTARDGARLTVSL